ERRRHQCRAKSDIELAVERNCDGQCQHGDHGDAQREPREQADLAEEVQSGQFAEKVVDCLDEREQHALARVDEIAERAVDQPERPEKAVAEVFMEESREVGVSQDQMGGRPEREERSGDSNGKKGTRRVAAESCEHPIASPWLDCRAAPWKRRAYAALRGSRAALSTLRWSARRLASATFQAAGLPV